MNRTVTKEETKKLFLFCHKHFVYHYDLQVELVDHLASSIEEQWQTNPEISFEEALKNTFKKFGIHGFSKIKQQKQKELRRKYNVLLWKFLFEFYRWPKILLTLALTMVLFTLFEFIENRLWIIVPYLIVFGSGLLYYYIKVFPERYKLKTKPGKSFMLLEQLKNVQFLGIIVVQFPLNMWNISKFQFGENPFVLFFISLFLVTFTIALYGNYFFIPEKIKQHFMEQFGEFIV
jgi:hypothetical protein